MTDSYGQPETNSTILDLTKSQQATSAAQSLLSKSLEDLALEEQDMLDNQ